MSLMVQNFVDYLLSVVSYAEKQDELVKELKIKEFCDGGVSFKDFLGVIFEYTQPLKDGPNRDMYYLYYYTELVKSSVETEVETMEVTDDTVAMIKELIQVAISPEKIEKKNDSTIEVLGYNLVLSEIIKKVEADAGFVDGTVKEVRIFSGSVLKVDMDLDKKKWHGKNFVVRTKELNVIKKNCIWNFSGNAGKSNFTGKAPTNENGNGEDGKDGEPGESGGNVYISAIKVTNGMHLKVISHGGEGGAGQDGGDGKPGVDGISVKKEDIDEIPDCAHDDKQKGLNSYNEAVAKLKEVDEELFVQEEHVARWGNAYISGKYMNGFEVTYMNFQLVKSLTLLKGTKGTRGGTGGKSGLGGYGGCPGEIQLNVPRDADIQSENLTGNTGSDGNGGYFGRNGIRGSDMARITYVKTKHLLEIIYGVLTVGTYNIVQEALGNLTGDRIPRYYGENGNHYLQLWDVRQEDNESVYNLTTKACVTVVNAGEPPSHDGVKQYNQRNSVKQTRQRQHQALAMQAINVTEIEQNFKNSFKKLQLNEVSFVHQEEVDEETEKQIMQQLEEQSKVSKSLPSDIKMPEQKAKIVEAENATVVKKNQEYEKIDLSAIIEAKYKTLEKIGSLKPLFDVPNIELNEVKGNPQKMEKFLHLKSNNDDIESLEVLSYLNKDLSERKEYLKNLKPAPFTEENQCETVLKEYIKEINAAKEDPATHGFLTKYENFSKHQLSQRLIVAEKYVESLPSESTDQPAKKTDFDVKDELEKLNKETFTDWKLIIDNKTIMDALQKHLETCSCDSPTFLELVAVCNGMNIRIYEKDDVYDKFVLQKSYNPRSNKPIYLNMVEQKGMKVFQGLELNEKLCTFELHRTNVQNKLRKILNDVEKMSTLEAIESYEKEKKYAKDYELDGCIQEVSCLFNFVTPGNVTLISKIFVEDEESNQARELRDKLTYLMEVGAASTLHYLADRLRHCESPNITIRDVTLIINTVLQLAEQKNEQFALVDWVLATRAPEEWLTYMALIRLENYFQENLNQKRFDEWEKYLKKSDKNIIILFCLRLSNIAEEKEENVMMEKLTMDQVDLVLHLLSVSNVDINAIANLAVSEWTFVLKEFYWKYKLRECIKWENDDADAHTAVYFLLKIENKYQYGATKALMDAFTNGDVTKKEDKAKFLDILQKFADEAWNLSPDVYEVVKKSKSVSEWHEAIKGLMPNADSIRTLDQLIDIMQKQLSAEIAFTDSKLKSSAKRILLKIPEIKEIVQKASDYTKKISSWTEEDLQNEAKKKKDIKIEEMLGMIDHSIFLYSTKKEGTGWHQRDAQKLSALIAFLDDKKILEQVATGEGKSLIIAALSIMRVVMLGMKVDVITTSPVLAERDVADLKDLYSMFNITVSANTSEDISVRKEAYKCDLVYGDLASFQRDYLLHKFYNKGVRGDREFQCVVVDEVDSMLLDKGNSTLYLSHEIPELDKLESIYLQIWTRIILSMQTNEVKNVAAWDTKNISSEMKKALYGLIDKRDLRDCNKDLTNEYIDEVLNILKEAEIIDDNHFLVNDKTFNRDDLQEKLKKYTSVETLIDPLLLLIQQRIERERFASCPNYLKEFVLENLDRWIDNAKLALYLKDREDYVVDVDHHNKESNENIVTIIDRDTGIDQVNSQWDSGLHQFLQLKHGVRLTPQSLKAVFISNISYFMMYPVLTGLSGTLGSEVEREHLVETHKVDFITIPTFKQKQFSELTPIVESSVEAWNKSIFEQAIKQCAKRSVLIVCETVTAVEELHKFFLSKQKEAKFVVNKYTRDYEELDIIHTDKKLTPGYVLIATNLAGRGTDLKLDESIVKAGGLHVIVSYLTTNDRVEQQAMGRAARKGQPGSGQVIINSTEFMESNVSSYRVFKLRSQRRINEAEYVHSVKTHYETQIKYEEKCFLQFNDAWEKNRKTLSDPESKIDPKVQELLERGVLDKWAFWLDSNLGKEANIKDEKEIFSKMDDFVEKITTFGVEKDSWEKWVDNLAQAVSIGKILAQDDDTVDKAINVFESVIINEPDFCESAKYYLAIALSKKNKRDDMVKNLTEARQMYVKRKDYYQMAKALIASVKERTSTPNSQSMAFEDQQEQITTILNVFIKSIDDIVGHFVSESLLGSQNLSPYEIKVAMSKLLDTKNDKTKNVIINGTYDRSILEVSMRHYCALRGINLEELRDFMDSDAAAIKDLSTLVEQLKAKVHMPNREEFWKILVKANILTDIETFYHIKETELETVDPTFVETVRTAVENTQKKPQQEYLYLYPEAVDESANYLTLEAKEFLKLFKKNDGLPFLTKHNCFILNDCAKLDIKALENFKHDHYASINVDNLVTDTINSDMASKIITSLVDLKVLKEESEGVYKPTESFYEYGTFTNLPDLKIPALYMEVVEPKIRNLLAYAIATHELLESEKYDKTTTINLYTRPYESLVGEMISQGVISSPKLNVSVDGKESKDAMMNIFNGQFSVNDLKEIPSCKKFTDHLKSLLSEGFVEEIGKNQYKVRKNVPADADITLSVQNFVNTIYKLYTEEYRNRMEESFKMSMGTLKVYGADFYLITKPLYDFTPLKTKKDDLQFILNGQDDILLGMKKDHHKEKLWKMALVLVVALVKIAVGALIIVFTAASPSAINLIKGGVRQLLSGLVAIGVELDILNPEMYKNIAIIQKAIRFVMAAYDISSKFWEYRHDPKALLKDKDKIIQVIKSNSAKLSFGQRVSQFASIIQTESTTVTDKAKKLMNEETKVAVGKTRISELLTHLYGAFDHEAVDKKIQENDNAFLSFEHFSYDVKPKINEFKNQIINNVQEKTKEMGLGSLGDAPQFKKACENVVDTGIKMFENQASAVFSSLNDNVLKKYSEGLDMVANQFKNEKEKYSKNILRTKDMEETVEAKYNGTIMLIEKSSNMLLDDVNADILMEVNKVLKERSNDLINEQLKSMKGYEDDPIIADKADIEKANNLEKLSLMNAEYDHIKDILDPRNKPKYDVQVKTCKEIKDNDYEQLSETIINNLTKDQYEDLIIRYGFIFGSNIFIFADKSSNSKMINETLIEFASSKDSKNRPKMKADFNHLIVALVDTEEGKYSVVIRKLNEMYQKGQMNDCFDDAYKLIVLATIADENEDWIKTPTKHATQAGMGVLKMEEQYVIAATHSMKQPFIWHTFKVIDGADKIFVVKTGFERDVTAAPSVKLQLLKHIADESYDLDKYTLYLNGLTTLEVKSDDIEKLLEESPEFYMEDGPKLTKKTIELIFKYKEYLPDLLDVALYCECNRAKFKDLVNEIKKVKRETDETQSNTCFI